MSDLDWQSMDPAANDGAVTLSLVERLRSGCVEHARRWSGDTHTDLGGSVDEEATDALMREAADEIERLRSQGGAPEGCESDGSLKQTSIPEGWVLVPSRPSTSMRDAFFPTPDEDHCLGEFRRWHGDFGNFVASYVAMINASPKPEGE